MEVRRITSTDELKVLPEIQKNAWGFEDKDVEPHHLMTRVAKYGGLIMGLFDGERMQGFTYAIIGKWENEYFLYSHMAAVRKECQGKGYGFLLKRAQREAALEMGYDVIRWNFDPLEAMNAYFNIHRLGVISIEYDRNIYGKGESGLHKGLTTDRLIATWNLNDETVIRKMDKKEDVLIEDVPLGTVGRLDSTIAYIETPIDIRSLKHENMEEAIQWRANTKAQFEEAFKKGFVVRQILFNRDKSRVFYKLFR